MKQQTIGILIGILIIGIIMYIAWMNLKTSRLKVQAAENDLVNTKKFFDLLTRIEDEFFEGWNSDHTDIPAESPSNAPLVDNLTDKYHYEKSREAATQSNDSNITQELKMV